VRHDASTTLARFAAATRGDGMTDRDLFLHEYIDIVGQHQWDYMEHAKAQAGHEKVDFELLGTWYTMGTTA
jgi:hypothetical protein